MAQPAGSGRGARAPVTPARVDDLLAVDGAHDALVHLGVVLVEVSAAGGGWVSGTLRWLQQVVTRHRTTIRGWNGFMRLPVLGLLRLTNTGLPPRTLLSGQPVTERVDS